MLDNLGTKDVFDQKFVFQYECICFELYLKLLNVDFIVVRVVPKRCLQRIDTYIY